MQISSTSINDFLYNQLGYTDMSGKHYDKSVKNTSELSTVPKPEKTKNPEDDPKIRQEIDRLKAIEEKVKAHEQAHKSAGGQFAGAVNYQYTVGPDGKRYITGGEVAISIQEGKTPDETIRNMEIVKRAALAPADPSPQDRSVAAQADAIASKARSEKLKEFSSGENTASDNDSQGQDATNIQRDKRDKSKETNNAGDLKNTIADTSPNKKSDKGADFEDEIINNRKRQASSIYAKNSSIFKPSDAHLILQSINIIA